MGGPSLEALIQQLPEVYQPIYGVPEIDAARSGDEARVLLVLDQIGRLSRSIGRPLRLLDLGSAQGYLTFRLAELGHHVTGVESLGINVEVARAIHARHVDLDVAFLQGDLPGVLTSLDLATYDVVVAFSVLHHIAHRDGHDVAAQLVADLAARIPHGLFEMAVPGEPLFWAEALPPDPRITLSAYAFIREIGWTGTHLSDVLRPVFFCSQSLSLVGRDLVAILSHTDRPHADANPVLAGTQRYYLLPIGIAKIAAHFGPAADDALIADLKTELRREAETLATLRQSGLEVPELLEFADSTTETLLVRTIYPGVLLSEAGASLSQAEQQNITTQVLGALGDLEERGLYHCDLRLWNVIWDRQAGQVHLIDYGSVGPTPHDTMWPFDAYFSLLTFLSALWGRRADQTGREVPRSALFDSGALTDRAATLASALIGHPRDGHVFRDLMATWSEICATAAGSEPERPLAWRWIAHMERQRDELRSQLDAHVAGQVRLRVAMEKQEQQLIRDQEQLTEREAQYQQELAQRDAQHHRALARAEAQHDQLVAEASRKYQEQLAQHQRQQAASDAQVAQLPADQAQLRADQAHLADELTFLRQTFSWRLTSPLRSVRSLQRRLFPHP